MTWELLFDREHMPSFTDVEEYIRNPLWNILHKEMIKLYKAQPKLEFSRCSLPGWNIKYKQNGKNLCTIYPQKGTFKSLIIVSKVNEDSIKAILPTLEKEIQQAYKENNFMNGGKWVFVDVTSQKLLNDVRKLIVFRTKRKD